MWIKYSATGSKSKFIADKVGIRGKRVGGARVLFLIVLGAAIVGNIPLKAEINLWVMSFDNLYSNAEISWLSEGFVDFILDHYMDNSDINARKSEKLDQTLADIRKHPDDQTIRNLVLSGAYERKKGEYIVELQLIDVITWETVADRKVSEESSDLAQLVETVNKAIDEILSVETSTKKTEAENSAVSGTENNEGKIEPDKEEHGLTVATKNIGGALDALVNAYYEKPTTEVVTRDSDLGNKLPVDEFSRKVQGFVRESYSFEQIINRVFDDPYVIVISEPSLRRLPLEYGNVALAFTVDYQMKHEILEEMIETLRVKDKEEGKDFTEYTFSGNDYVFTNEFIQKVAHGQYRFFPVISLIGNDGAVIARLIDTPGNLNHLKHFNPMFNITAGPWTMMIYLNKKQQIIDYEITLPIQTVARISQIMIDMVNEDDIVELDRTK